MSKNIRTLVAVSALTICTAILPGCASTTAGGTIGADRKQLLLVSSSEILQLSNQAYRETLAEARQKGTLDVNKAQVQRLKRIADRLIPHTTVYRTDANTWNWEVHSIQDKEINAYVLPGGKIVFYSGIIERLNLTDDEIAAIMGHEMAHALREHSREKMSRQVVTGTVMGLAASALGLSGGKAELFGLAGDLGLSLPHSRAREAEADKMGLELMARAGYNPNAAVTLWQKMESADKDTMPQFLSTHPSNAKRIKTIQELIPTVLPLYHAAK